jgi:cellulose synthase (UDP-forming)
VAVISIIVTIYYLYWRVTETLNPNAVVFSWALYGAEFYGAIITFLFFFMVWKIKIRTAPPPLMNRSVDVLITTKKESIHILRKTLLSCNDLKYPHRTLVLDDANRPEVKALCEALNCIYLARPSHEHAKAGNLNYGLQHSNAEFVAVFDADHVPLPHFINRLIGYFKDEKVAFVQTPHEFYNIDSFQHRVEYKKKYIWGEQYMFYSLIQPGKDRLNAAYFVGSCAIIRKKALDDTNGFATGSITEDMLTSILMHAKGWSSVYHNENLAYGIAAETLYPFHIQRQRWGLGNWQIFFKSNPLFVRGLSISQRLCYLASMIYPFEGFQKIIFYATPVIVLYTGVLPMRALDINYLMHFIPYFAISLFAFNELARGFGGTVILEQFSMGKFFTYMKSIFSFLFPKKRSDFKVTPKGEEISTPYRMILPQMIVFLASISGMIWGLTQIILYQRTDNFVVAVNCFWALFNSGLALAIIQYDYKKLVQRRERFRIPEAILVEYSLSSQEKSKPLLAVADNLNEQGLSMLAIGYIHAGQDLSVNVMLPSKTLKVRGTVVQEHSISSDGHQVARVGVHFTEVPQDIQDMLSRYIHESSVVKFIREYSTRYKTYLERRFRTEYHYRERLYRALAYLPVLVWTDKEISTYAVVKDISETGLLLTTKVSLLTGSKITIEVILGRQKIILNGTVMRSLTHEIKEFPEFLAGIQFDETSKEKVKDILTITEKISSLVYK